MAKRVVLTFLKKNAKEAEVSIKDEDGESYKIPLQRNSQKGGKVQVYKDLRGNPYTLPKGGWRPTESDANPANTYIKAINEIGETAPKGKIVRRVLAPAVERTKGWISQKQRIEAIKGPIREKFAERAKEPSQQNLGRYQRLSDLKKDLSKTADQRYKDRVTEIKANKWNSGEQKADLISDAMKTYEEEVKDEKLTPEERRDKVLSKLAGPTGKVDPAQRSQVMDRFRVEKEIEASKEAGGQGPGSGGNPCR
jgi:hypothetical protein